MQLMAIETEISCQQFGNFSLDGLRQCISGLYELFGIALGLFMMVKHAYNKVLSACC